MKSGVISILCMMFATCGVLGQHLYQQPKPLIKKSDLDPIIGTIPTQEPSRELNIVWVYGYDEHHIAGAHDYVKVKNLMVGLLSETSKVNVEEAFGFPTEEQLRKADLLVMYLHLPQLKKKQFKALRGFVENGGGLIALHESMIMRPRSKGKRLARCFGFAWKEGASKWGAIFDKINIDNQHPIFKGFSQKYWAPYAQVRMGIVLGPYQQINLPKKSLPSFGSMKLGKARYLELLQAIIPSPITTLNSVLFFLGQWHGL